MIAESQENLIKSLIENSKKINSNIFNLDRIIILALIAYVRDGLQYRELKSLLGISDGKLQSNLNLLTSMGYIQKEKVHLDNKKITIYMIREISQTEIKKIKSLIDLITKLWEEYNEK